MGRLVPAGTGLMKYRELTSEVTDTTVDTMSGQEVETVSFRTM
jgi:hypothetical protein